MTTYGTIPASSSPGPSTNLEFISRARERIKAGLGTRRPWNVMFSFHSLGLPANFGDSLARVRTNVAYFRMNYAIVVLFILFLSLLWHPISLIVFLVMMAAWLFLYFLRDQPLMVFNRTIDDRVVLVVLGADWCSAVDAGHVKYSGGAAVGVVVVLAHAAARKTDDLFMDEEAAGLMTGVGGSAGSASS
ncbi:PRA1 family protein F2 [Morella rubra]|uniref:PRA1 family protein n=1 Tax=Morella rubra TaxID=262757 RepID=A0A6A1VZQ3_9ROSI|nr:PRA1 family protein F2 [Morella rubra]